MIIKNKKEEIITYLEDTSNIQGNSSLLYLPKNREEILAAVNDCVNRKIVFTVSSGRTGTTGGCVPFQGAIISMGNLRNIINIDKDNNFIELECGVPLENLEKEANRYSLTLRAAPTESLALIGGAIATGASGVRGFGYGSIRNYVAEIDVCLTTGDVIRIKRGEIKALKRIFNFEYNGKKFKFRLPSYNLPKVKSQAGYFIKDDMDLIDLFIGSEGTLGIILSCKIILQKIPVNIFDGLIFFKKERNALCFINEIKDLKRKRLLFPASLEFMDINSLDMLKSEYSFIPQAEAGVYFEQEVEDEKDYGGLIEKWQRLIEVNGGLMDESIIADTSKDRKKIFEFRHKLPQMINEFLRQNNQIKTSTDIAVPWQKFEEMYFFYKEQAKQSGLSYVNFGHIGESHLHFNFLPKNGRENLKAKTYMEMFCRKAVFLGGTVSAEHGIGKLKKPYLKIMYKEEVLKSMASLKKIFDPYCLLGLDNIFEKELLL